MLELCSAETLWGYFFVPWEQHSLAFCWFCFLTQNYTKLRACILFHVITERAQKTQLINTCLKDCCHCKNFAFLNMGQLSWQLSWWLNIPPVLSGEMDRRPGAGRACWEGFQLGMKEDGGERRLARDEPGRAMAVLGVQAMAQPKYFQWFRQQIGGTGSHCVASKLWPSRQLWNMMGPLPQLHGYKLFRRDRQLRRCNGVALLY